ncbi:hypothetical protein PUMCH_004826 [Australozyma saopauloensis]|uniref:Uncharacterized protein n=1 Tax=Australozyma saopauloensis TaxID=291208 RepID=A0AAX4HGJ3_9ASCO|nr:hypothetical protein PUMCH_004826 [[Candida] saopauloensis]
MSADPLHSPPSKSFQRTPTSWDTQDDVLLLHLKDNQKLGWKEIASHFHNRTPNACQFRWRRLKSGNLKNPPKSMTKSSGLAAAAVAAASSPTGSSDPSKTQMVSSSDMSSSLGTAEGRSNSVGGPDYGESKSPSSSLGKHLRGGVSPDHTPVYSPAPAPTFRGYELVNSALAGLNASASAGHGGTGMVHTQTVDNLPQLFTHLPQAFPNLPRLDVPLDPQTHSAAAGTSGGYFTDISVDPTLNLPHNKPHMVPSSGLTPRGLTTDQMALPHNNSIIQIVRERDDRNSISLLRHSVLSLPSKSMNIPHHQTSSNALAHLPILFGGSSISGAAGGPNSISGPSGLPQLALTLSSIRNGSIVGSTTYLRRLSMLGSIGDRRASEREREKRAEREKSAEKREREREREVKSELTTPKQASQQPIFRIPWSMEEDELLINRRQKELSFAELSILLPQRTEGEIWLRIDALERIKNGHRALVSRATRRRQSLFGLDDVDDFYNDVESVIGSMESDDEEHALVDLDDQIQGQRRARKRRASSAVNPLTVREGIRGRFR